MKKLLAFVFLTIISVPSLAQWRTAGGNDKIIAFGVHNGSLFISLSGYMDRLVKLDTAWPWVEADAGIDFTQGNVTSFASLGQYFFVGITHSDGSNGPVFISTNDGSSWKHGTTGGPVISNGSYLFATYTSPSEIIRSRDGGKSWDSVAELNVNNFDTIGVCIFANTGSALWRSTDTGGHLSQLPSPPFVGSMTTMGSLLYITANGNVIVSADSGGHWNPVAVDSGSVQEYVNVLVTDEKNLFAGTKEGVFISTDSGKTWKAENEGLSGIYLNVNLLGVFDTLLFANCANIYTAYRPISEMTAPASVAQMPSGDTIEVYPNPASGIVTIQSGGTSILGVRVLNVLGEGVLSTGYRVPSTGERELDFSKLPSGTYFVQIQTSKRNILRKLVKE